MKTVQILDRLDNQTVDCKVHGYIIFCKLLEKLNLTLTHIIKSLTFSQKNI